MSSIDKIDAGNGFNYVVTDEQMNVYAKMSDLARLQWVEDARVFTLLTQTPVTKARHEKLRKGNIHTSSFKTVKRGRPTGTTKTDTKISVKLRLSPEVVEAYRATGRGWQTRINDLLVAHVKSSYYK